jgi:hypothetical protein
MESTMRRVDHKKDGEQQDHKKVEEQQDTLILNPSSVEHNSRAATMWQRDAAVAGLDRFDRRKGHLREEPYTSPVEQGWRREPVMKGSKKPLSRSRKKIDAGEACHGTMDWRKREGAIDCTSIHSPHNKVEQRRMMKQHTEASHQGAVQLHKGLFAAAVVAARGVVAVDTSFFGSSCLLRCRESEHEGGSEAGIGRGRSNRIDLAIFFLSPEQKKNKTKQSKKSLFSGH